MLKIFMELDKTYLWSNLTVKKKKQDRKRKGLFNAAEGWKLC
jgi:hypothetical protein